MPYKAKDYVDGGVARIIFVVKFGAVAWISRVTQFAVIPCGTYILKLVVPEKLVLNAVGNVCERGPVINTVVIIIILLSV